MTSLNAAAAGKNKGAGRRPPLPRDHAGPPVQPDQAGRPARAMTRTARVKAAIVAILARHGDKVVTVYELQRELSAVEPDCPALSTIYRHMRRLESSGRLAVDATRIGGRPMLGYRIATDTEAQVRK